MTFLSKSTPLPRVTRAIASRWALILSVVAAAIIVGSPTPAAAQPHFKFFEPVIPPRSVQVMAHRGLQGIAPENSAAAVLACGADFIEWAEVDVRLTNDGRHVVLHDATLDRTSDGRGPVASITVNEFLKLDTGSWFAPRFKGTRPLTLSEMLKVARSNTNLYLDCKQIDPELLVQEIVDHAMESQVVVYDAPEVLKRVRAAGKNAIATMTKFRPKAMDLDAFVKAIDPAAVEIDADEVTAEICRRFHDRGIKVQAKVLGTDRDNPATWARMIDAGVDWLQTDDPAGVRFNDVRRRIAKFPVQIAHHRGANRYAPENTLPAIRTSVALGADYIEIDIRTTKDGRLYLLHDRTANRTTDGTGAFAEMTAEAVATLDAGAWFGKSFAGTHVPTLDEALTALGDTSAAYLDAKEIAPEVLLAAIKKYKLLERSVVYQSPDYLAKLRALEPTVRTLPPLGSADDFEKVAAANPFGVDARWSALSRDLIARCHATGIRVFSDAIGLNETLEQYRQAMDWGIDVIQTDHPLRVLRAIELHASSADSGSGPKN
jgi:glycerophosphoryl diester phosphodiesterase